MQNVWQMVRIKEGLVKNAVTIIVALDQAQVSST